MKKTTIAFLVAFAAAAVISASDNKEQANIYFNAGTEKYLQGSFSDAVEDLEKAQSFDASNTKIKELMIKILLEAATQNHMKHNYQQAMKYLEKAKTIAPDNPRVSELYHLTKGLMNPEKEEAAAPKAEKKRVQEKPAEQPEQKARKQADPEPQRFQPQPQPPPRVEYVMQKKNEPAEKPARETGTIVVRVLLAVFVVASGGAAFAILGLLGTLKTKDQTYRALEEQKNNLIIEYEKAKERLKFEHITNDQLRSDLEQAKKQDYDKMKMELEMRTKQIEEKVRAEMMSQGRVQGGSHEAFLHQQQAKFLEYMGDSSQIEDTSSPVLDAMRDRISLMAMNLYEYSQESAIKFLVNMVSNENPLIRTNVVQALSSIAKKDTVEMLIKLYEDKDSRVKREVIKNMKKLVQKINAGELTLDEMLKQRMEDVMLKEKAKGEWIF